MTLKELLDSGTFVFSCDLHVPAGKDPQAVASDDAQLWKWADVLRIKMDSHDETEPLLRSVCSALKHSGFELEVEVKTRNFSRPEIGRTLVSGCDAGIENFLIFTQDYWLTGDSVQEMMFFHVDAGKFFSAADSVRQGHTVDGQPLDGKKEFLVGAGIEPQFGGRALDAQLTQMEQLVDSGVGYFVTNPVFDADGFERFMDRAQRLRVPVIAEIVVLSSASEARLLNSMSWISVPQRVIERLQKTQFHWEESLAMAFKLVGRLRDVCAGIHVLPYGDPADIEPVVRSVAR